MPGATGYQFNANRSIDEIVIRAMGAVAQAEAYCAAVEQPHRFRKHEPHSGIAGMAGVYARRDPRWNRIEIMPRTLISRRFAVWAILARRGCLRPLPNSAKVRDEGCFGFRENTIRPSVPTTG